MAAVPKVQAPPERRQLVFVAFLEGGVRLGRARVRLSPREMELLAVLALRRSPVDAKVLLAEVWPKPVPIKSLHVYVHRVRTKTGDPGVIELTPLGYVLGSRVACDLWNLENRILALRGEHGNRGTLELGEAKAMWRRLSAWDGTKNEVLRPTILRLRSRLGRWLSRELLQAGAFDEALAIASQAMQDDPCDEVAAEAAIRARLASGDRSGAARDLLRLSEALHSELALSPPPHLRELIEA